MTSVYPYCIFLKVNVRYMDMYWKDRSWPGRGRLAKTELPCCLAPSKINHGLRIPRILGCQPGPMPGMVGCQTRNITVARDASPYHPCQPIS